MSFKPLSYVLILYITSFLGLHPLVQANRPSLSNCNLTGVLTELQIERASTSGEPARLPPTDGNNARVDRSNNAYFGLIDISQASGAIDHNLVEAIEHQYHDIGADTAQNRNALIQSPEYRTLVNRFLADEYRNMSPHIRRTVDRIRADGLIPIFRAIAGDWVPPSDREPYSSQRYGEYFRHQLSMGIPRPQAEAQTNAHFRQEVESMSLSITGAVEVASNNALQQSHEHVQLAIMAWDGRTGMASDYPSFAGGDPMEVLVAPITPQIREVITINPAVIRDLHTRFMRSDHFYRVDVWPATAGHIHELEAQSSTH